MAGDRPRTDPGEAVTAPPGGVAAPAPRGGLRSFLRQNPQVLVLLIICIVLGLGTFIAVIFGLLTAGSTTTNGEPSGVVAVAHVIAGTSGAVAHVVAGTFVAP